MLKQLPAPEGNSPTLLYFQARLVEWLVPSALFILLIVAATWLRWYVVALAGLAIYLFLLLVWLILSVKNRPVNLVWTSTEPRSAGSGELWQLYSRITELMRTKARWTEIGDTPVEDEGEGTDNAVALYKHPLLFLVRAPVLLVRLFRFEEMYKYLRGGNSIVMLQYPELNLSISLDAWKRIEPHLNPMFSDSPAETGKVG